MPDEEHSCEHRCAVKCGERASRYEHDRCYCDCGSDGYRLCAAGCPGTKEPKP